MPDQSLNRPASGRNDASPLTYADYLRAAPNSSESSGGLMSEEQWKRLTPSQQWGIIGGGFMIDPNDPRYADLAGRAGGEEGRNIIVQGSNPNDSDFTDPNLVHHGQGYNAYRESSLTPAAQQRANASGLSDKQWAALVATMFGGAALAGGALGGAGAAAGGGAGAAEGLGGLGIAAEGSAGIGAGAAGSAAFDFGTLGAGAAGAGGLGGGAGGSGSAGLSGLGEAAGNGSLEGLGINAEGAGGIGGSGAGIGAGGEGAAAPAGRGLLGQGIDALGGPSGVARMGLGLAGALGGGSGGSNGGGNTDVNSIIEQMARVNRVNQTTPVGSRTWSQDANGQWSVADAMSAPEQANFTNVQGMNADVTGMARQRLAAMLARPAAQRYDRPLGT